MRIVIISCLAFFCLFAQETLSYIGNKSFPRNQKIAKRYLRKIDASLSAWIDPTAYNGLLASGISNLRKISKDDLEKAGFQELYLRTEKTRLTRVLLKIHDDKRPLITFIAGLSSPADANYFAHFALPLAKYFGFNVAIIESYTSRDWGERNEVLLSSGYGAGWDVYQKLKVLRTHPDVEPYVSEMHVVGISLGGSDVSFATYFDSILKTNIIDGGVLTFSSPADRINGFKDLRGRRGISAIAVTEMYRRSYGDGRNYKRYTDKPFSWIFWTGKFEKVIEEVYLKATNEYFRDNSYHFDYREDLETSLFRLDEKGPEISIDTMLKAFDLTNYFDEVKKPILWIHSKNDPVVLFETHQAYVEKLKRNDCDFYPVRYGGHVGYPHAYGGAWTLEHIVKYVQYWGNFSEEYYLQWKKPYQKTFPFSRYLKNLNSGNI